MIRSCGVTRSSDLWVRIVTVGAIRGMGPGSQDTNPAASVRACAIGFAEFGCRRGEPQDSARMDAWQMWQRPTRFESRTRKPAGGGGGGCPLYDASGAEAVWLGEVTCERREVGTATSRPHR